MTDIVEPPVAQGSESPGPEILMDQLKEAHIRGGLEAIEYVLRGVPEGSPDSGSADAQPNSGLASDAGSAERMASSRQTVAEILQEDDLGLGQVIKLIRPAQNTNKQKSSITPIRPADVTSIEDVRRLAEMQFAYYGFKDSNDIA